MASEVNITRYGNLLEVDPPCEHVLSGVLTYGHRVMLYGRDAVISKKKQGRSVSIKATRVYTVNDGKLYVQHGVLPRVTTALEGAGYRVVYKDARKLTPLEPDYDSLNARFPDLEFRCGQDQALAYMISGERGQLEAPTGWGKTTLLLFLAAVYPKATILVCTLGQRLLNNTVKRLTAVYGTDVGECSSKRRRKGRIMVTTYGSVLRAVTMIGRDPDIVVVDECHSAAAPQFASNLSMLRNYQKIFGLTATPKGRSDGAELVIETLLGPVVFRKSYADMVEAGAVCPIKVARVDTSWLVEGPEVRSKFSPVAKQRAAYWRNRARNQLIARCATEVPARYGLGDDPQVLILVEKIEHANHLVRELPDFEIIHSMRDELITKYDIDAPKCDELQARFEAGTLRKAIATGVWGTGVDFVQLDVLIYASGAPSHITTTQWSGRNSRVRKNKEFGLVVDFSDRWDEWTAARSVRRMQTYKKHGWKIDNIVLRAGQQELPDIT
mgnify:FL=1|jgi:superfamily II DNA or RNA helicase